MKDLKLIAQQLRKPSGDFADKVADKMTVGNRPLYDLTLHAMKIKEKDSILEIGFGSGVHFKKFLSQAENVQICGIDYSEEMVSLANFNNRSHTDSGQLKLFLGNSDRLPFRDNQFDKVFCNMVIYFWDQPEKHLSEIHRVLKPSGKFFTGMRSRNSMLELPFTKFGFNLYTEDQWTSILKENGFTLLNSTYYKDPPIEENGKSIHLESICLTAQKE